MLRYVTPRYALRYHSAYYGSTLTWQNNSYGYAEVAVEIHVGLKYVMLNTTNHYTTEYVLHKMKMPDFV